MTNCYDNWVILKLKDGTRIKIQLDENILVKKKNLFGCSKICLKPLREIIRYKKCPFLSYKIKLASFLWDKKSISISPFSLGYFIGSRHLDDINIDSFYNFKGTYQTIKRIKKELGSIGVNGYICQDGLNNQFIFHIESKCLWKMLLLSENISEDKIKFKPYYTKNDREILLKLVKGFEKSLDVDSDCYSIPIEQNNKEIIECLVYVYGYLGYKAKTKNNFFIVNKTRNNYYNFKIEMLNGEYDMIYKNFVLIDKNNEEINDQK